MEKLYTLQARLAHTFETAAPQLGPEPTYPWVSTPPTRVQTEVVYDVPVTVVADSYAEAEKLALESLPEKPEDDTYWWRVSLTSINILK